jgi:hypothetical protein
LVTSSLAIPSAVVAVILRGDDQVRDLRFGACRELNDREVGVILSASPSRSTRHDSVELQPVHLGSTGVIDIDTVLDGHAGVKERVDLVVRVLLGGRRRARTRRARCRNTGPAGILIVDSRREFSTLLSLDCGLAGRASTSDRFSTPRARPRPRRAPARDRAWGAFSVATTGVYFRERYFSEVVRSRFRFNIEEGERPAGPPRFVPTFLGRRVAAPAASANESVGCCEGSTDDRSSDAGAGDLDGGQLQSMSHENVQKRDRMSQPRWAGNKLDLAVPALL